MAAELAVTLWRAMGEAMGETADRLEAGDFDNANAARKAMDKAMKAKMAEIGPPGGGR